MTLQPPPAEFAKIAVTELGAKLQHHPHFFLAWVPPTLFHIVHTAQDQELINACEAAAEGLKRFAADLKTKPKSALIIPPGVQFK